MVTRLFKLKLCRFQVCCTSPREFFVKNILIPWSILIMVYNSCNLCFSCSVDIIDMDDRIKGTDLRGTKYTISQDGLCPRCGNSNRLYVILDKYVFLPLKSLVNYEYLKCFKTAHVPWKRRPIRSEKNLTAHNLTFWPIRVTHILFLKNKGNNHKLKKLLIAKQILPVSTLEMYG